MNFLFKGVYRFSYFAVPSMETARKAAIFFLHDVHLVKLVLSGTPLLRTVQYDRTFLDNVKYELRSVKYVRTFLDNVKYEHLLKIFTNANWREQFAGFIIIKNKYSTIISSV